MLGISATTLFLAALIPGLATLVSIQIANLIVNCLYDYEGGGMLSFGGWLVNPGARSDRGGMRSSCPASSLTASFRAA